MNEKLIEQRNELIAKIEAVLKGCFIKRELEERHEEMKQMYGVNNGQYY